MFYKTACENTSPRKITLAALRNEYSPELRVDAKIIDFMVRKNTSKKSLILEPLIINITHVFKAKPCLLHSCKNQVLLIKHV